MWAPTPAPAPPQTTLGGRERRWLRPRAVGQRCFWWWWWWAGGGGVAVVKGGKEGLSRDALKSETAVSDRRTMG